MSAGASGWVEYWAGFAAARGARVSGIDAAEGMVELARHKLPGADLRVGPIEELPWPIAVAS